MHKGQRDHQGTLSPTLNKHESNSKNKLIDRLFDRPTRTDNSQRPRVFSTDPNRHKLTPTIVREHHRKAGGIEKLPSI